MSKQLINDPKECVDEFIEGFLAIHSGLLQLPGHRVILRQDLENLKDKVALLCGGGSGHEPIHAGFVGKGMLTGAISGAIFTSPPPLSIFAAIKAVNTFAPSGVLLIVKNYTGDRLNFGLAMQWALNEGIKVDMVNIGEDCALTSVDRSAGRRGLAGVVLVHKIAGALAQLGKSIEEIMEVLTYVTKNLGTIGVCLYPCTLPGNKKPTFDIGESEIEIGLGVHGEAGVRKQEMGTCHQIVSAMIDHMTDTKSSTHLSLADKNDVVVLLNNLGGTSNLEMGIFAKEVIQCLQKRNLNILRTYCGTYVTSLQMAGVSLTVLKLSHKVSEILPLLDMETNVATPLISIRREQNTSHPQLQKFQDHFQLPSIADQMKLNEDEVNTIKECISNACHALKNNETLLNEYDTGAGDADCGTTHTRGANAILKHLEDWKFTGLGSVFQQLGTVCSQDMGGSSGALYSIFMTAAARQLAQCHKLSVTVLVGALKQGLQSMQIYGGAKTGDRTMIDVLDPILNQLTLDKDRNTEHIISSLIENAQELVQNTRTMKAKAGRASYVNSSYLIHPDPGAQAVGIIITACAKSFHL